MTMVKIVYIEHTGVEHQVDAPAGGSVMEAAVKNNLPGIEAECGGACSCATCHVFVDELWRDRTGAASPTEASMLEYAASAGEGSRLACQIRVTPDLEGLVVRLPACQY
jgi:2Fe-2S ferredoxin